MSEAMTLVLDQGYAPVDVVPWHRAITLLFLGKVEVVESYQRDVRCTTYVIKVPAVVRLLRAIRRHRKPVKFSRVNVYGRDNYRCQYCGDKRPISELTYDHVLPRSHGGRTTWENIVTACTDCNGRKADRTPERAGMRLLKKPVQPASEPAIVVTISRASAPDAWRDYLYWTGELDQH